MTTEPKSTPAGDQISWLKAHYFADPQKHLQLQAGDALLEPGQLNTRLFLILEGALLGYLEQSDGQRYEIFHSGPDNLVGVYSFFSPGHSSYSHVIAGEPTVVAYLDAQDVSPGSPGYAAFAEKILPIVVDEIYLRQLLASRLAIEREDTLKQLAQMEQLAALGQMAAGLAHELNNAVGVIQRSAAWTISRLREYIAQKDQTGLFPFFIRGLDTGSLLSSAEVRQRRQHLEEHYNLDSNTAKNLAKTGLTDQELTQFGSQLPQLAERIYYYFEMGRVLNDMAHAAEHATRVVQSVHQLGVASRIQPIPTDLNDTIRQALQLLSGPLETVILDLQLGTLPPVTVNPSDWVQVWVNLIKNAAEAMAGVPDQEGHLLVRSSVKRNKIFISIADNGPGIPAAIQDKIFQPNVTTKVDGLTFGLGLGLAIVQKIVTTYRGGITLDSKPGNTVFTVWLPV